MGDTLQRVNESSSQGIATLARGLTLAGGLLISLACAGLPTEFQFPVAEPPPPPAEPVSEPAPTPSFFYIPGSRGVADASYSAWKPGDRVFVAADATNLRSKPSIQGEVVDQLDLGVEVEILASAGDAVELIGRRNVWYQIRTRTGTEGFLFGAVLSPLRVALEAPGRSEPYVAVVSFSPAFGPRVRLWDAPDGPVFALDARPPETFAGGGTLRAEATSEGILVTLCDPSSNKCHEAVLGMPGGELTQIRPSVPPL